MIMKKIATLLIPFSLFAGSFEDLEKELFDDFNDQKEELTQEVSYRKKEQASQAPQATQAQSAPNAPLASKTSLKKKEVLRYTLGGDMLYMKPYFSNVPYLSVNNLTDYTAASPQVATSHIKSQTFDGDFGFRLYGSFMTSWQDVTIASSWTRFHTKSSQKNYDISNFGSSGYGAPEAISYIWNSELTEPQLISSSADLKPLQSFTAHASGHSTLKLDLIDLMFQFPYKTKKRLKISPSLGVLAFLSNYSASIHRAKNYNNLTPVSVAPYNQNLVSLKQTFRAIGPSLNFGASMNLGGSWAFDLLAQGSCVFGQLKSSNHTLKMQPNPSVDYASSAKANTFKGIIDLRMGLSWDKQWDRVGLIVRAGYDLYFMPSLMQLINQQTNSTTRSDLSMQGVYAGLGLQF